VQCTGSSISLLSSTATVGYTAEVRKSGPDDVEVRFDPSGGGDHLELKARCNAGAVSWG
jgi:hypothetical protein